MDTTSIRTPSTEVLAEEERLELRLLEERYHHELMDENERCEVRERILRLRCKLSARG